MVILSEVSYTLTGILVIFYLAMIHLESFKQLPDEPVTSLDDSEDIDELDDSFEENFTNLFLLGKGAVRTRAASNYV